MREPFISDVPFSQCSVDDLQRFIAGWQHYIRAQRTGVPDELVVDVDLRYAALLIREKST